MYSPSRDSPISTSKLQEGMNVGGRVATNIPKMPPPSPKSQKNWIFGQPENGTAKFHGSKSCRSRSAYLGPARCAYRGERRDRTRRGPMPSPLAFPLVPKVAETSLPSLLRELESALRCRSVPWTFPRGCNPYAVLLVAPWRTGPPLQPKPLVPGFEPPTLWPLRLRCHRHEPAHREGRCYSLIVPAQEDMSHGCRQPAFRLLEP